jgi:hypothetical protein
MVSVPSAKASAKRRHRGFGGGTAIVTSKLTQPASTMIDMVVAAGETPGLVGQP